MKGNEESRRWISVGRYTWQLRSLPGVCDEAEAVVRTV
jgi:hypothetical protein